MPICSNKFSNFSSSDDTNESNNWFISIFANNKINAPISIFIYIYIYIFNVLYLKKCCVFWFVFNKNM